MISRTGKAPGLAVRASAPHRGALSRNRTTPSRALKVYRLRADRHQPLLVVAKPLRGAPSRRNAGAGPEGITSLPRPRPRESLGQPARETTRARICSLCARRLLGLDQGKTVQVDRAEAVARRHVVPRPEALDELVDFLLTVRQLLLVVCLLPRLLVFSRLQIGDDFGILRSGANTSSGSFTGPVGLTTGLGSIDSGFSINFGSNDTVTIK